MISIVIPAYNESRRILRTLEEYHSFFTEKLRDDFELIIVPNSCKDNTLEVVENFSKNKKNIIICNLPDKGKGGAVIKGFEIAKGNFIGFVDADNSTNPENFFKLYENIGNFDGIIASRRIKGAKIDPPRTFFQNASSWFFNKTVKILLNLKYEDTQCGAKLFKKETAKEVINKISEKGWIFDVDLLQICKKNNFQIHEYPIIWTDSKGSVLTLSDGIESFIKLFRYSLKN